MLPSFGIVLLSIAGAPDGSRISKSAGGIDGLFELIWVNYNELTTSSLDIIVSKGNHPQMALIQVSELL